MPNKSKFFFTSLFMFLFCSLTLAQVNTQTDYYSDIEYDTTAYNVFKKLNQYNFKLNFYHSDGYSHKDRYWYEIIILDSLVILNFQNNGNQDDWDYIKYQKQYVASDEKLDSLKQIIKTSSIKQKKKGFPIPNASGYTGNKLFIEYGNHNIAGGTFYINLGIDATDEEYNSRIATEMKNSSSISGDFITVYDEILTFFPQLGFLLTDMPKTYY